MKGLRAEKRTKELKERLEDHLKGLGDKKRGKEEISRVLSLRGKESGMRRNK